MNHADAIAELKRHDRAYAKGKPKISDAEYDKMRQRVQKKYPADPYFKQVGAKIEVAGRQEVTLPLPMPSLDKKRPQEAAAWVRSLPKNTEFTILPKMDGLAVLLEYRNGKFRRAFTRGEDGKRGQDITHTAKHVQGVLPEFKRATGYASAEGTSYVTGEVIIHKRLFTKHFHGKQIEQGGTTYKTPRNFCTGMLLRLHLKPVHVSALQKMTFVAFGLTKANGNKLQYLDKIDALTRLSTHGFTAITLPVRQGGKFRPLENYWYPSGQKITPELLTALMKNWREKIDILQDGIVVDINQHVLRKQYGFSDPRPGYAYAVKPAPIDQETKIGEVARIDWQISSRKLFKPVVILKKALDFEGVSVQRISVHNAKAVQNLGLRTDSKVRVIRSGSVIPVILGVVDEENIKERTTKKNE